MNEFRNRVVSLIEKRITCFLVPLFLIMNLSLSPVECAQYDYDNLNRLISVTYDDSTIIVFTYDDAGNRQSKILRTDSDADGIIDDDETNIYGTDPNNPDSDGDGMNDGDELAYWGSNWNVDYDNDGLNNLLDADSDNDGFTDLVEINQGFDPADPDSHPSPPDPNQFNLVPILDLLLFDSEL